MTINHKKAYWRNRLAKEADEMRQVLVAKRALTVGNKRYPVGSILPANRIPQKTLGALLDSRGAQYQPRVADRAYSEPVDLPKPVAAPPNPKPEIVHDNDIVDSWFFTENAMTKACNGNRALARDILFSDASCRDLYQRAQREQCARVAKRLGRPSVTPNEAGMC
jgi:hypothetical protein